MTVSKCGFQKMLRRFFMILLSKEAFTNHETGFRGGLRISLIAVLAAHQSLYFVPSSAVPPLVDRMS